MKTHPIERCPGCHHADSTAVALGEVSLRRCSSCGLVHASDYADPDEVYVDGYFSGEVASFGLDTRDPEFRAFMTFCSERRMRTLESITRPPGRLLDVGCGCGELLEVARDHGWDTVGVDLVPDAVKVAVEDYGLDVRNSKLEESGLPERSFDVVCATHVLEHQLDGLAFLELLARWAKPGGHVLIEVPNWASADRWRNRTAWAGWRPLEHLAHYGPKTLKTTMRRAGLEPVKFRSPSYQYHRQTLGQAMHDLGLSRFRPRFDRFTVTETRRGETIQLPRPTLRQALRGVETFYDAAGVGVVVVGIARVP